MNYNIRLCQEEKAWPHLDLNSKCKFHIFNRYIVVLCYSFTKFLLICRGNALKDNLTS